MRKAISILAVMGIAAAVFAQPDNEILQHNENLQEGVHYDIDQYGRVIEIYGGIPGEVFMFEAIQKVNGQYVGPGDINLVTADDNAGTVELTFVGHNGHPYGAANIKEIRLNQPGVTGVIQELNISGDLGELGPIIADVLENVTVAGDVYYLASQGAITGSLTVGGDVVA